MFTTMQELIIRNLPKVESKQYTTADIVAVLQKAYPELRESDSAALEKEVTVRVYQN